MNFQHRFEPLMFMSNRRIEEIKKPFDSISELRDVKNITCALIFSLRASEDSSQSRGKNFSYEGGSFLNGRYNQLQRTCKNQGW